MHLPSVSNCSSSAEIVIENQSDMEFICYIVGILQTSTSYWYEVRIRLLKNVSRTNYSWADWSGFWRLSIDCDVWSSVDSAVYHSEWLTRHSCVIRIHWVYHSQTTRCLWDTGRRTLWPRFGLNYLKGGYAPLCACLVSVFGCDYFSTTFCIELVVRTRMIDLLEDIYPSFLVIHFSLFVCIRIFGYLISKAEFTNCMTQNLTFVQVTCRPSRKALNLRLSIMSLLWKNTTLISSHVCKAAVFEQHKEVDIYSES